MASEIKHDNQSNNKFTLRVPLDASRLPDCTTGVEVSVLAWSKLGPAQYQQVRFGAGGQATAIFEFETQPEGLQRIAVGPATATAFELQRLQTISVTVPAISWSGSRDVTIPPIQVSAYHWWWWQHWKQNFKVRGQILSSRGVPIPGASVHAFDIDAWWWWTAQEQVGQALTDEEGFFALEFTRASGWYPWWWWVTRDWQTNPELVGRITAFVGQYAKFGALPQPTPTPTLEAFQPLLAASARPIPPRLSLVRTGQELSNGTLDPASLEVLRERLAEILPRNFPLPVWPWSACTPWEDCGANLIFRVTDTCGDETTVLLNESVSDIRWDIPSTLDVTLSARDADLRERRPGWTLVDYLFPGDRSPVWRGSVSDDAGAALGRPA